MCNDCNDVNDLMIICFVHFKVDPDPGLVTGVTYKTRNPSTKKTQVCNILLIKEVKNTFNFLCRGHYTRNRGFMKGAATVKSRVLIIGAGAAGIASCQTLVKGGIDLDDIVILEARDRYG